MSGAEAVRQERATVAEAIAEWEAHGPTSLTVALMADALYGVAAGEEWAATDVTCVEYEIWPDAVDVRVTSEAAEAEFVHDGDDVLLRRYVTPWQPVPTQHQDPPC